MVINSCHVLTSTTYYHLTKLSVLTVVLSALVHLSLKSTKQLKQAPSVTAIIVVMSDSKLIWCVGIATVCYKMSAGVMWQQLCIFIVSSSEISPDNMRVSANIDGGLTLPSVTVKRKASRRPRCVCQVFYHREGINW